MILCDSDVLIEYLRGNEKTKNALESIGFSNVLLSVVTIMELYQGARNKESLAAIKRQIRFFDVLPIDAVISQKAVELIDNFGLSHGLRIMDGIIASSALVHDLELFTYNLKDFVFLPSIRIYRVEKS